MKDRKYLYRVYGLNIESNVEIPEFINVDKINEDDKVIIRKDNISINIKSEIQTGKDFCSRKNNLWFNVDGAAIYEVKNGNEIIFEPYENADIKEVNIFLTCSCLGFIMLQRGKVAIHGGCVVIEDKAVIITGERGAGKSTLTTEFRCRHNKLLSDDVASIDCNNDEIKVNFGFPYQKLCSDAMDRFALDKSKYNSFMSDTQIKYSVPVYDDFLCDDITLKTIFEITCGDVKEIEMHEIKGIEKLKHIMSSVYRGEYMECIGGMSSDYLKKCTKIASKIKYYNIIRPIDKFCVDEEIEQIERVLKSTNKGAE